MSMNAKTDFEQSLRMIRDPESLKEIIREQQKAIDEMATGASVYATVVDRDGDKVMVANSAMVLACFAPPNTKIGQTVLLNPQTMQIARTSSKQVTGRMVKVVRQINNRQYEIEIDNGARIVNASDDITTGFRVIEPNTSVIVDPTAQVIVAIAPPKKPSTKAVEVNVNWNQIGGNDGAKKELIEAIASMRSSSIHKAYGATAPKGFLLYGPPGTGKTLLGKAVATEMAAGGPGSFIYVKAPEILSKFVGSAEMRVREIFEEARAYKFLTNKPAIVFIDEADAILSRRGSGVSSDVEKSIVPSFLTEMDGMEDSGSVVIIATNRPDSLDPAIIRDGRIDRKIYIGRPEQPEAQTIFEIYLNGLPMKDKKEMIARHSAETLFMSDKLVQNVSGAMIAAIVNRAKQNAIRKDITRNKVSGLASQDVLDAIAQTEKEYV